MSTLSVDAITGKSTSTNITIGSTPVVSASANSLTIRGEGSAQTSIQQGLAKGRIHIDLEESNAVRDSFNMSFVTDEGTGESMVGITNNMADIHYVIHVTGSSNRIGCIDSNVAATTQYSIEFDADGDGARADTHHGMTTFHGDLA